MQSFLQRTELLVGQDKINKIKSKKVAIFGLGGVGSYALETLVRAGFNNFSLIDNDIIETSNINRQIFALHSTIGKSKVDVAKSRVMDINPEATVEIFKIFYTKKYEEILNFCDYVVDAMDTVSSKLDLIEKCYKSGIKIISCMGTANRLNPTKFAISDIYETYNCPLCRIMRHELKKRNIPNLKVVFSSETPINIKRNEKSSTNLGSISFVPPVAGCILAGAVYGSF